MKQVRTCSAYMSLLNVKICCSRASGAVHFTGIRPWQRNRKIFDLIIDQGFQPETETKVSNALRNVAWTQK